MRRADAEAPARELAAFIFEGNRARARAARRSHDGTAEDRYNLAIPLLVEIERRVGEDHEATIAWIAARLAGLPRDLARQYAVLALADCARAAKRQLLREVLEAVGEAAEARAMRRLRNAVAVLEEAEEVEIRRRGRRSELVMQGVPQPTIHPCSLREGDGVSPRC